MRQDKVVYFYTQPKIQIISKAVPNPQKRIAIKLKSVAENHVRKGHPWVFSDSIIKQNKEGVTGDLAIVFDKKKNEFLACGLWDQESPIRIKVLQFKEQKAIDNVWLLNHLKSSIEKRKSLFEITNGVRLVYGESDGLPGLIVDQYGGVVVMKLYSGIWIHNLIQITTIITELQNADSVVLRLGRNCSPLYNKHGFNDGDILSGNLDSEVIILNEFGVKFNVNVIHGHKTGFFLDHRQNRNQLRKYASGKSVLDVFSYAGGFGIHALVGGAKRVTCIDISKHAMQLAEENAALNDHHGKFVPIVGDAFKELDRLESENVKFDIVVIDPPSFAKKASESGTALKQYMRLAKLGAKLVSKGGMLILASCSSRISEEEFYDAIESTIRSGGHKIDVLQKTNHDIDHPSSFKELSYLKCGYYSVS